MAVPAEFLLGVLFGVLGLWYYDPLLNFAMRIGLSGFLAALAPFSLSIFVALEMAYVRYRSTYDIDNDLVVRSRQGLAGYQERGIQLAAGVHLDVSMSALGRLLNVGTLGFWSGDVNSRVEWNGVRAPLVIREFVEAVRDRKSSIQDHRPPRVVTQAEKLLGFVALALALMAAQWFTRQVIKASKPAAIERQAPTPAGKKYKSVLSDPHRGAALLIT